MYLISRRFFCVSGQRRSVLAPETKESVALVTCDAEAGFRHASVAWHHRHGDAVRSGELPTDSEDPLPSSLAATVFPGNWTILSHCREHSSSSGGLKLALPCITCLELAHPPARLVLLQDETPEVASPSPHSCLPRLDGCLPSFLFLLQTYHPTFPSQHLSGTASSTVAQSPKPLPTIKSPHRSLIAEHS